MRLVDLVGDPLSDEMMKEAQRLWSIVEKEAEARAMAAGLGVGEWESVVSAVIGTIIDRFAVVED